VTNETVRAFSRLKPVAAIVTKTDENVSIGAVLSALIRFRLPAAYAGTGQAVPGDLIRADNRFFVRKLRESYKLSVDQAARQRSAVG
jgi:flagellar biosynthesis protein FlhF